MARKDSRQPARIAYQWIALILLGLALGGGIRIATGGTPADGLADEETAPAASRVNRELPSSAAAVPRPAASRAPAVIAPAFTAEQAGLLLEDPSAYQPDLARLLTHIDDDPPFLAPEATALAELFGWDDNLASAFSATLHDYAAIVRQLIDGGALVESPRAGFLAISYDEIAGEQAAEVKDLKERLRGLIGGSDLQRLEGIGFFQVLEEKITPEQNLLVRLAPLDKLNNKDRVTFQMVRRSDLRPIAETIIARDPDVEEWTVRGKAISLLPAIDWSHEIERVMDPERLPPE